MQARPIKVLAFVLGREKGQLDVVFPESGTLWEADLDLVWGGLEGLSLFLGGTDSAGW